MTETLNLSAESTKVAPKSERGQDLSASPRKFGVDIFPEKIIQNQDEEAFTVESHTVAEPEASYYEEPDLPRQLPPLQHASFLRF